MICCLECLHLTERFVCFFVQHKNQFISIIKSPRLKSIRFVSHQESLLYLFR